MADVTHVQIASIWIDVSIREQHNWGAEATRHPVESGADITDHVRLLPDELVIEGVVTNQPIEPPGSHADGAVGTDTTVYLQRERTLATGVTTRTIEGEPSAGFLGLLPGVNQGVSLLRAAGLDPRARRRFEMVLPGQHKSTAYFQSNALVFSKDFDRVGAVHDALRATFDARKPVQIVTGLRVYESVVLIDLSIMRDASNSGTLHFGCTGHVVRVVKSASALVGTTEPAFVRATPKLDKGTQTTVETDAAEVSESKRSFLKAAVAALSGGA